MDPKFWLERWENGETGWHRDEVHTELETHWRKLELPEKSRVLVPLCGASPDMAWLAAQGHEVIGVELSRLAVETFLKRHRVYHVAMEELGFRTYHGGRYQLWCGDFFATPADLLASISAVYDRASLVALPPDLRERYARFLADHLVPGTPMLLISLSYDQSEMKGPPFSVPPAEVERLFASSFDIAVLNHASALDETMRKRGLSALDEHTYLLRRKPIAGAGA
ncbi:MAG: thiopurine S-methyltransferase [Hyphomicrobiaceae bacterium]|nr:thiopurine S-methyltransferase [Hyphomicrobiaceae bacterium]